MKGTFEKTGDSDTPNFAFGSLLIEVATEPSCDSLLFFLISFHLER